MPPDEPTEIGNSETLPPEPDRAPSSAEEAQPTPQQRSVRERLIQLLFQHSEPAAVPAMYPFLKQDDDIRQLTLSSDNFLAALRTEFTDLQLTERESCALVSKRLHPLSLIP